AVFGLIGRIGPIRPISAFLFLEFKRAYFHLDIRARVRFTESVQQNVYLHRLVWQELRLARWNNDDRSLLNWLSFAVHHRSSYFKPRQSLSSQITDGSLKTHHDVAECAFCFSGFGLVEDNVFPLLLKLRRAFANRGLQCLFG